MTQAPKHPRSISRLAAPTLAAVGLLALAGCGGSSSSSGSSGSPGAYASPSSAQAKAPAVSTPAPSTAPASAPVLKLAADPAGQLKYDTTALSSSAGAVSIDFSNSSPVAHNVTVASASGQVVGETPTFQGGTKRLSLKLQPGTYKFFCSVPGHRAAGMEGTLTVK